MLNSKPWFNSWPAQIPRHMEIPQVPLQYILCKTSEAYPNKTAVTFEERELNYSELDVLSNQFANALTHLGVKKGDRVAVFLPNIPQFIIAFFGILKTGAVVTALSPLYRDA